MNRPEARAFPGFSPRHLMWGWLFLVLLAAPGLAFGRDSSRLLEQVEEAPHWVIGPLILLATISSEDLACLTTGILASRNVIPLWYGCLWCWIGIFVGDIGLYVVGRVFGERVVQVRFLRRFLTAKRLQRGRHLFEEHGAWMLFSARFLPGSRLPAFIAAGILKFPLPKFAAFLAFAGLLWTPVIVSIAHWWGSKMDEWLDLYEKYVWLAALLSVALASITIRFMMPFFSERGRRLLLAKLYRTLEWEFWPPFILYVSLLPSALWQALKSRHAFAFTAANPAIPYSGLALESRSAILEGLCKSPLNREVVGPWKVIAPACPEARLQELQRFQETLRQPFPIVLKPDVRERGQGVVVAHSEAEAAAYLSHCLEPVIAQEHLPGLEFGVYYYRLPGSSHGRILSVTGKQLLSVAGNGHSTLEELILHHPRAMRMAPVFLREHRNQLDWVPSRGEMVALGEVGNHCRGALFTDARHLVTDALRDAVDEISRRYEGFFIGRFDLRVSSLDDLQKGLNLRIVELNGVSAEVTHIYQPGYPFWRGRRDLANQWRLAYQIGEANLKAGVPAASARDLARLAWRYWRRRPFEAHTMMADPELNENRASGRWARLRKVAVPRDGCRPK